MPDYNVTLWKQIADEQGIDYSGYSPTSLQYEETWIRIVGGNAVGEALDDTPFALPSIESQIQSEVENMPDYANLIGLWLPGYDPTNQTVKNWASVGNDGLRGNSLTLNTSSPTGSLFDGTTDFIQVQYHATMGSSTNSPMTIGGVASQNTATIGRVISQGDNDRSLTYWSNGGVYGYLTRERLSSQNRTLNTSEHYMVTGTGSEVNVYKNGALANGSAFGTYNSDSGTQPLYIGRNQAGADYFSGNIYCVYIYNSNQDANSVAINTTVSNILTILGG